MNDDELQVSYSVKEILARIETKVDDLAKALALKADAAKLEALEARVEILERTLHSKDEHARWLTEWRRWLIPVLMTAVFTAVTIITSLHH